MPERHVVFVVGVPRSGSTWLTDILSSSPDTDLVMEPDNEKTSLLASCLKAGSPRFPVLAPGEAAPQDLGLLWDCAFTSRWAPLLSRGRLAGGLCRWRGPSQEAAIAAKPAGRPAVAAMSARHPVLRLLRSTRAGPFRSHRIVKSVHAVLYPEWIVERCRPQHTLVIMRHPLAVLQSWRRMQMPDAFRLTGGAAACNRQDDFVRMAGQLAAMYVSLRDAAATNPDWTVTWHEQLWHRSGRADADDCGTLWPGVGRRHGRTCRADEPGRPGLQAAA